MFPAFVMLEAEVDLHEGTPLGPLRFADQMHAGLQRRAVGLARVAAHAGANDVFPRCWAAAVAGNDVVEVQVLALEDVATILAGVAVALENVVPRELHFLLRQAIENDEQDDARNPDAE